MPKIKRDYKWNWKWFHTLSRLYERIVHFRSLTSRLWAEYEYEKDKRWFSRRRKTRIGFPENVLCYQWPQFTTLRLDIYLSVCAVPSHKNAIKVIPIKIETRGAKRIGILTAYEEVNFLNSPETFCFLLRETELVWCKTSPVERYYTYSHSVFTHNRLFFVAFIERLIHVQSLSNSATESDASVMQLLRREREQAEKFYRD